MSGVTAAMWVPRIGARSRLTSRSAMTARLSRQSTFAAPTNSTWSTSNSATARLPTLLFNNGHTIQVNVDAGSAIVYNGIRYDLLQFHFHAPSEHTLDGQPALMEIHFVHQDPNSGNLAVVGVLLIEGDQANAAYAPVFDNLPAEVGEPEATGESLALAPLLPEARTYYTYQGSLTTPPCSEIARWLLLANPVALSAEQIGAFTKIYAGNARPTQPLGMRDLLLDSG